MLNYLNQLFKVLVTILIVVLIGGAVYVGYNLIQSADFTASKVVEKYVKILENPSKDVVTSDEKTILQDIVETSTVASWFNQAENQIKTLRNFKQNNQIKVEAIEYSGVEKNYATVKLNFENDLKNPNGKTAKLYLQRQGNFWTGYRWKIYQIDLPIEDSPLDDIKNQSQDLLKNIPNPFNLK